MCIRDRNRVDLRHQNEPEAIFKNILQINEYIDITICNPPFHASAEEALAVNKRKNSQLKPTEPGKSVRNFGGQPNELWCIGGEDAFVRQMITESIMFKNNKIKVPDAIGAKAFSFALKDVTLLPGSPFKHAMDKDAA